MQNVDALMHQLAGLNIGGYRIDRLLGSGGMGAVFLATHQTLPLQTAIKVMLPQQPDTSAESVATNRFLHEARALSGVHHSSLVSLYDCGKLPSGMIYLQMEYIKGETLNERIARSREGLNFDETMELCRQLASALTTVHKQGIVHRDLKPSNIIIAEDAEAVGGLRAKLLDFSIAKFRNATIRLTETGHPLGTPRYMSPEQCEGSPLIDSRTDVYSLGLLIFEMLTGESPYPLSDNHPLAWLYAHLELRPRRLGRLLPFAPAGLEELITAMLDKIPLQRPAMDEVEQRLRMLSRDSKPTSSDRYLVDLIAESFSHGRLLFNRAVRRYDLRFGLLGVLGGLAVSTVGHRIPANMESVLLASPPLVDVTASTPTDMVHIPGRLFTMGTSEKGVQEAHRICVAEDKHCALDALERELPQRQVFVDSFYIGKFEITNRQYADFINQPIIQARLVSDRFVEMDTSAGSLLLLDLWPDHSGIEHVGDRFRARDGMEDLPVVQVTWDGAQAYCVSHGRYLPTEAQWELAAQGGGTRDGRAHNIWPWGTEVPRCDGVRILSDPGQTCTGTVPGPVRVGTSAQDISPQGVYDLGGNVREWVRDVLVAPYPRCTGTCRNPGIDEATEARNELTYRVVRGSNYYFGRSEARSSARGGVLHSKPAIGIGFRCAASALAH